MKIVSRGLVPLAVLLMSISTTVSNAQLLSTFDWTNPDGGVYGVFLNWRGPTSLPGELPDADYEMARIGLPGAYMVQVRASYTVGALVIQRGTVVMPIDSYDFTYKAGYLDISREGALHLIHGTMEIEGFTAVSGRSLLGGSQLVLFESSLESSTMEVGDAEGRAGQILIDGRSRMSSREMLVLGRYGEGLLEIEAGYQNRCILEDCTVVPSQGELTTGTAIMAMESTSTATAEISGIWNTDYLTVGDQGAALVRLWGLDFVPESAPSTVVSSVGRINSLFASIAAKPDSLGIVEVAGASEISPLFSEWTISYDLSVGGTLSSPGGEGYLVIGDQNRVTVGRDLTMWSTGTLSLVSGGVLDVTGTAALAGNLEFRLAPTTLPAVGDQFDVLRAGQIVGDWSTISLPALSEGLDWAVNYSPSHIWLTVIPMYSVCDLNLDRYTDAADAGIMFANWGSSGLGDCNQDGVVDAADAGILFEGWTADIGPKSKAVPEPRIMASILWWTFLALFHQLFHNACPK